jgi:hypothetical protein
MTEEDEEFNRIEREAAMRKAAVRETVSKRQWVELTEEAIWLAYQTLWPFHPAEEPRLAKDIIKFARIIEQRLKEKNT